MNTTGSRTLNYHVYVLFLRNNYNKDTSVALKLHSCDHCARKKTDNEEAGQSPRDGQTTIIHTNTVVL